MGIMLVTGANRGIGLEVCRQLAQAGHLVILTARDTSEGASAVAALGDVPGSLHVLKLDVESAADREAAAVFVKDRFGRLDVLVNNAGFYPSQADTLHVEADTVRKALEVHLMGPMHLCQLFMPMLRINAGRIINVSTGMSLFSEMGGGAAAYRISKTALNALTAVMAADCAGERIKVNAVCPGWVRTRMGGAGAPRSVEQGAETVVWLATAKDIPTGKIFRDKRVLEW